MQPSWMEAVVLDPSFQERFALEVFAEAVGRVPTLGDLEDLRALRQIAQKQK